MSAAIPVVASDAHLAHDGLVELMAGREVPCYESPARAIEIRRALIARGGYVIAEPDKHGLEPILAVHDHVLVDLLETPGPMPWPPAWTPPGRSSRTPS